MIQQFRSLNPLNIILLIGIAILLRIGIFIDLPQQISFEFMEPFARLLIDIPLQSAFSPLANVIVALTILLIQALIFNRIINSYGLLGKSTFLPALLYVTTGSLLAPFLLLSPTLICNFLVLWMIEKFLSVYKRAEVSSVMFDLGMLAAVGTLIYFPFISMLPLMWISLIIFRPFNWREWIAAIIGFITIFFFLAVFYYWNDSLGKFYEIWLPLASRFQVNFRINLVDSLVLIPVAIILVLGFFQLQKNFFRSVVQLRKSFQLFFFMFIIALASFYLKQNLVLYHFLLCAPPAAVLMAYYFLYANTRWLYESLYFILFGSIIYFQVF
ncbi:MAG: beta-carotene 15,15'-monooxygenase [Bacteroidetes bacterium]|nr:beta-carotene 15,15'-monooxygenase [Bacteroidota bacterium]